VLSLGDASWLAHRAKAALAMAASSGVNSTAICWAAGQTRTLHPCSASPQLATMRWQSLSLPMRSRAAACL